MISGERLCLDCGLCCDGSLFDNVRLGPGDDRTGLKARGLPVALSRAKVPVVHFRQPCSALCGDRSCRLYADRPQQCRAFECGVFKDAQAGRITFAAAQRLVRRARRQADRIRRLLRGLGEADEHRSLGERFRRLQRRMEAGEGEASSREAFAELGLAVHRFNLLAHEKFYTRDKVS